MLGSSEQKMTKNDEEGLMSCIKNFKKRQKKKGKKRKEMNTIYILRKKCNNSGLPRRSTACKISTSVEKV